MSDKSGQTTLEVIAPSIEEALQKGLDQLNLPEDAVEVEVLDKGNKGLFGLGSRDARVRLIVKSGSGTRTEASQPPSTTTEQKQEEFTEPEPEPLEIDDRQPDSQWDSKIQEKETSFEEEEDEFFESPMEEDLWEGDLSPEEAFIVTTARSTVSDLLERMNVNAEVTASYHQPEFEGERPTVWVDITGNDLSVLIGRKSQTLQALQYITSLILGKELERSVPLVIDVEGYRSRREAQLRRLAETMAEQAVQTGRTQALEPMTASERRIVHITLRNYPGVHTESIGEDPHRKVTIIPENRS